MRQFLYVLKFEIMGLVKGKWFRISTILICALIGIVLFAPRFIDLSGNKTSEEDISQLESKIGLYDPSGVLDKEVLQSVYPKADVVSVTSAQEMKDQVKSEKMEFGVVIKDATHYEYIIRDASMYDTNEKIISGIMESNANSKQLSSMGLSQSQISEIASTKVESKSVVLGKDGASNYAYTYILVFVLYFVLMFYGQMTTTNVASEKGNRTMEILVTSTSSNALIFGKVLAGAIVSVFQVSVILGVSVLVYQINVEAWNHALDFLFNIPMNVLGTFAIFGTLGYLFYSFIYGAVGSMVSKVEEVSAAVTPILIIFIICFFATVFVVMSNPESILATFFTYLPFSSCMAMFARVALGSVALWEVLVSAVILALSTIGMGILGAKLYRNGTLYYGNNFKFSNILKNIKKKN